MEIKYLTDHPELIPTLAAWFYTEWGHLSAGSSTGAIAESLKTHLNRDDLPLALVAMSGADVVGSASLRVYDMQTRKDLSPWLASVYVPVEHRRRGIGARLVEAIEGEAKRLQFGELYLYTFDKEAYYARLGWHMLERTEYRGGKVVIMRKEFATGAA